MEIKKNKINNEYKKDNIVIILDKSKKDNFSIGLIENKFENEYITLILKRKKNVKRYFSVLKKSKIKQNQILFKIEKLKIFKYDRKEGNNLKIFLEKKDYKKIKNRVKELKSQIKKEITFEKKNLKELKKSEINFELNKLLHKKDLKIFYKKNYNDNNSQFSTFDINEILFQYVDHQSRDYFILNGYSNYENFLDVDYNYDIINHNFDLSVKYGCEFYIKKQDFERASKLFEIGLKLSFDCLKYDEYSYETALGIIEEYTYLDLKNIFNKNDILKIIVEKKNLLKKINKFYFCKNCKEYCGFFIEPRENSEVDHRQSFFCKYNYSHMIDNKKIKELEIKKE